MCLGKLKGLEYLEAEFHEALSSWKSLLDKGDGCWELLPSPGAVHAQQSLEEGDSVGR